MICWRCKKDIDFKPVQVWRDGTWFQYHKKCVPPNLFHTIFPRAVGSTPEAISVIEATRPFFKHGTVTIPETSGAPTGR